MRNRCVFIGENDSGGEGGIRTPGRGFSPYNGLANRRLQPLGHLSGVRAENNCSASRDFATAQGRAMFVHKPARHRGDARQQRACDHKIVTTLWPGGKERMRPLMKLSVMATHRHFW